MALVMTVKVNSSLGGLESARRVLTEEIRVASNESGIILEGAAKQQATVQMKPRTGNLIRAIGHRVEHDALRPGPEFRVIVTVSALAPYGRVQEFGAGIYHLNDDYVPAPRPGWTVRPRRARALRWMTPAGPRFAQSVFIPGVRPHSFIRPGQMASRQLIIERYHAAIRRAARRL